MATHVWAPWLLTGLFLYIQVEVGNKRRRAFLLHFLASLLMLVYNYVTAQYGFIPANIIGCAISWRNHAKWRNDEEKENARRDCECVAGGRA